MKILVTGGAGFIGSHLCERLLLSHHEVTCIDNFSDFYNPIIKERNIISISKFPNFSLQKVDITDYKASESIFMKKNFDLVIHLAAMAGVRPSIENPLYYNEVNVKGTLNLLELCRIFSIKKFIFSSSSSVYGNNKKVPFSEEDSVDFPISPYAMTKKAGELLCHTYHILHDMSIICLRLFTVYGPRQRPDLAIHKFTDLIMNGKEIPLYGKGETERDYTYIDDVIDGFISTIEYIFIGKKFQIFNLGSSNTISLSQMIEVIEKVLKIKAKKLIMSKQPGDVERTYADISKSHKYLNYNPKTAFEEGIIKFIEWKELSKFSNIK